MFSITIWLFTLYIIHVIALSSIIDESYNYVMHRIASTNLHAVTLWHLNSTEKKSIPIW